MQMQINVLKKYVKINWISANIPKVSREHLIEKQCERMCIKMGTSLMRFKVHSAKKWSVQPENMALVIKWSCYASFHYNFLQTI